MSQELDYSSRPTELGHWNSSLQCGVRRGGSNCLGRWTVQKSTERDEGAGPNQNRYRFAAARQTVAHEWSGPHRRTTGTFGRHRLLRRSRQATGDFPEECRFLLDTQLMFLKKEKDPTSKLLDDDDWIRSLTEAQEITADVREDSVMDHQEVDPKKVRPIQSNGKFLRKYISRRLLALTEGETAALTTAMRQLVVGSQGGGEALAIFHHLLYDE